MAISSNDSPKESAAQRFASALVLVSSLLAGQLLLPEFINPPSSNGPETPDGVALVTHVQVPSAFHGHGFARPDPAYTEVDKDSRQFFFANGASSEWDPVTMACNGGLLPDSVIIAIGIVFMLCGIAVSRTDVREMSKKHQDAAKEFPFPTRPFVFVAVMVVNLAGVPIVLSDSESQFHQIMTMPPCVDAWVAQFFWAPADGIWSLPDRVVIVLLIAFAFFGFLASRVDMHEMSEENGEAAEDYFTRPTCTFFFMTVMLFVVTTLTFSAPLKYLLDQCIANALCLGASVAFLMQHASALPDNVMIALVIAFVLFGFVVSYIDIYEMSDESSDAAEHGFSWPTRPLIVAALVLSIVVVVSTFSAALLPDGMMIALVVACALFGFAVSRSDVYELSGENTEAANVSLQSRMPLLIFFVLVSAVAVGLTFSAAIKSLLVQAMANSLYADAWVSFALIAFTFVGGVISQVDYDDIRAELASSECAK